jgi:hypothetical protein
VTDLSPREFIFGKLAGIAYGAKEMIVMPLLLIVGLGVAGYLRVPQVLYLCSGFLAVQFFVTMLGVHVGLAYENSRTAIAVSLGIVCFLLVGIGTCMRIMIAFSNTSLTIQLVVFAAVFAGGGLGLYAALGVRNPSAAILLASVACPALTFVGLMLFLAGGVINVFMLTLLTYGFATLALLVPAIAAFDIATGRTTE